MEGLPSLPFCGEEFLIHIQPWPSHWPWPNARHGTPRAVGLFSVIQNCTNHGENEGSLGCCGCNLHQAFCWMQIKAWTLEVLAVWYHRIASQKGWCNQCSRWLAKTKKGMSVLQCLPSLSFDISLSPAGAISSSKFFNRSLRQWSAEEDCLQAEKNVGLDSSVPQYFCLPPYSQYLAMTCYPPCCFAFCDPASASFSTSRRSPSE